MKIVNMSDDEESAHESEERGESDGESYDYKESNKKSDANELQVLYNAALILRACLYEANHPTFQPVS